MLNAVTTIWNSLLKLQGWLLIVSSLLVVLAEGMTVIMRYFLKIDLFGIEEIIIIPAFWLYFIGASLGTYYNHHISAELVSEFVKNNYVRLWIRAFRSFVTTLICLIMFYWAMEFVLWSFSSGKTSSTWQIPEYIMHTSLFFGFLFMSMYFLVDLVKEIKELIVQYKTYPS